MGYAPPTGDGAWQDGVLAHAVRSAVVAAAGGDATRRWIVLDGWHADAHVLVPLTGGDLFQLPSGEVSDLYLGGASAAPPSTLPPFHDGGSWVSPTVL